MDIGNIMNSRPSRPQSHLTGDLAHKHVAVLITSWGWTADNVTSDYGEDIECNIFTAEQRTNFYFRIQAKGTLSKQDNVRRYRNGDYRITIQGELCRQWASECFPILLTVHDGASNIIYWCHPVQYLRKNPSLLTQASVTFRVPLGNILSDSKSTISELIEKSYARLLKLDEPHLKCEIYPLLMPGYKSEPSIRPFLDRKKINKQTIFAAPHTCQIDDLPGWLSPIKSLQPYFIYGISLSSKDTDLDNFIQNQRTLLTEAATHTHPGTWLAFVISPIRLEGQKAEPNSRQIFRNEITDWNSLALVKDQLLVWDNDHAFQPPAGFIRTIGRRARSWNGHFLVDRGIDIALQFLAPATSGPSDLAKSELFKMAIRAQLLPWICADNEIYFIQTILNKIDLTFKITPDVPCAIDEVVGVIVPPMTDPELGMFHLMMNWDELEGGTRKRLSEAKILEQLPGREGGPASWAVLESLFSPLYASSPTEVLFNATEHRNGLPINHSKRLILVSGYRRKAVAAANINQESDLVQNLARKTEAFATVESVSSELLESLGYNIAQLKIAIRPNFSLSSKECMDKTKEYFVDFFDAACPRESSEENDTFSALHLDGELYFEGHEKYIFGKK